MPKAWILPLLFVAGPTLAQTRLQLGPVAGATLCSVHYGPNPPYTRPATTYHPGFEAGLLGTLQVGHLAVQSALLFAQKGYNSRYDIIPSPGTLPPSSYANTTRLNYLTLPVNLAYTQRRDGQGWQAFAGPYASCLVGGHYQSDYTFYTLGSTGEFEGQVVAGNHNSATAGRNDTYSKRWDVGVQAGLGYRYQQVLLQAGYSLGVRNLAATIPGYPAGTVVATTPIYNRGFHACLAYLFGHHA